MRILVVSNFYPPAHVGGYELECKRVVDGLAERHEVLVLTSVHRANEVPAAEGVLRVLPHGAYRRRDVARAPLWSIAAARAASRTARAFDPDVVFIWNGTRIPQVALWKLERSGVPVVYRVCEGWFSHLYSSDDFLRFLTGSWTGVKRLWSVLARAVNAHPALRVDPTDTASAAVAWVSETLRAGIGPPPAVDPTIERVVLVGVPDPGFDRTEPSGRPVVGFVGRVSREKAPDVAIRAVQRLEATHGIEADLAVVGTGPAEYLEELRGLAAELGVAERVRFLGRLEHLETMRAIAKLTALVVPSRWQEPSGTVASEAAMIGTPVVSSRSGGMPEYLPEGECALYFEIDDVDGCADAIARTLRDPAGAAERAAQARRRAQESLTVAAEVAAMESLLLEATDPLGRRDRRLAAT